MCPGSLVNVISAQNGIFILRVFFILIRLLNFLSIVLSLFHCGKFHKKILVLWRKKMKKTILLFALAFVLFVLIGDLFVEARLYIREKQIEYWRRQGLRRKKAGIKVPIGN
jgi:hypothetical protein